MTRYEREFEGIPARFVEPTGLDPNYADGYLGMRTRGRPDQAAYGEHRRAHEADLGTAGGFGGIHRRRRLGALDRRRVAPFPDGGVTDPFRDDEFLADFDARRVRYASDPTPPAPSRAHGGRTQRSAVVRPADDALRTRFTNRGVPPAGFSEGWARGPMRGSR